MNHSVGEYVREQAHTNGLESFWAPMKRGYVGVYHKMSPKHLQRYVDEFLHRHNNRPKDTIDQMAVVVRGLEKFYKKLIEDNGMKSHVPGLSRLNCNTWPLPQELVTRAHGPGVR